MKKSISAIAASLFVAGVILTSCNTSAEKVENAQNNVTEANKDLDKANQEYLADVENYRKETAGKIAANYQSIVDFNAKIEHETKKTKATYKKRITELEQKNTGMKKKMDDYKADGNEKWQLFKTEFSKGMDEIGKSLKDLTAKNV